ncbi:hypothetical protein E4U33_002818 [Claviceps sp. LM78 group G4]|nr:hypothetical protein E4U33_002818 [Claviceps sp. LM78 group G4]
MSMMVPSIFSASINRAAALNNRGGHLIDMALTYPVMTSKMDDFMRRGRQIASDVFTEAYKIDWVVSASLGADPSYSVTRYHPQTPSKLL